MRKCQSSKVCTSLTRAVQGVISRSRIKNRDIALIENGTWAPSAIKAMNEILEPMKNIHIMEPTVTIRSTLSEKNKAEFQILIKSIMEGGCKDEICV